MKGSNKEETQDVEEELENSNNIDIVYYMKRIVCHKVIILRAVMKERMTGYNDH